MPDTIPSFFVYGEPDRPLDVGFIHVETVMERKNVHLGHVWAHKHDRMAQVTFWTKGRGRYFLEESVLDFSSPAISFVPSGVVHGFEVEPAKTDAIVVSIADSALPPIQTLSLLPLDLPVIVTEAPDNPLWFRISDIMNRMADEYREGRPGMEKMLASLAAATLTDIARLAHERPSVSRSGRLALSTELRRLVDRHFRENWAIQAYVDTLGTTPHLLAKACREAFGLSVKEFINERRLLEAKRLLLFTVRSVEDIAYEIGLKDAAYFSRFFKHHVDRPPSEWRQDYPKAGSASSSSDATLAAMPPAGRARSR
ncbi:helix-turn-helix domain-containing protein [Rhizobium sp. TH2]|uniref:AraC family transcriptional regulator n=1 Tax=Rhizobium sp. TH2 TaxID=2775403 RepID=UPI002157008A|nr:AraC family transcriptional regulator [Rhizobium sp. TH2]UVC08013.1 helix-turn-helix domain-containing protein [Rhizobium sp. TH2]